MGDFLSPGARDHPESDLNCQCEEGRGALRHGVGRPHDRGVGLSSPSSVHWRPIWSIERGSETFGTS